MDAREAVQTLRERRDYLRARIISKQSIGWDTTYDLRECEALTWALENVLEILTE